VVGLKVAQNELRRLRKAECEVQRHKSTTVVKNSLRMVKELVTQKIGIEESRQAEGQRLAVKQFDAEKCLAAEECRPIGQWEHSDRRHAKETEGVTARREARNKYLKRGKKRGSRKASQAAPTQCGPILLTPLVCISTLLAPTAVSVPPAVLVDAISTTVEGPGVLVFTALAMLDVDGDELLDSARAVVLVGTGVDVALNPVVLDDVDASTLVLTAVANDGVLLLNTCVDGGLVGTGVHVSMNPVVLNDVDASTLVLTAVADDDMLLLNTCVDGVGMAVLVILEAADDVAEMKKEN